MKGIGHRPPARPADFDSATVMAAASARHLRGRGFPVLGKPFGELLRPVLVGLNHLPERTRRSIYRAGSGREGLPADVVSGVDADQLFRTVTDLFPRRRYPGVLIGSTPGSAVHLGAALGMPVLPQTLLLPLRHRRLGLDDPEADVAEARPAAEALLEANPDLVVHQMADPANDRLTLARFSYFRVKRTALGRPYEQFLSERVEPGGTVYVIESGHRWPTARIAERYFFQFGGVGGLSAEEYLDGGPRVEAFLAAQGSTRRSWSPPAPDADRPEAEWGLQPGLIDDVQRVATRLGLRVVRVAFDHADDLSPFVAELYRWWYRRLGRPDHRLFVESFVLVDPYWMLRAGAVPYWITFNAQPGLERLADYLRGAEPYDVIEATLISNGTWTPGLAGPDQWKDVLACARRRGRLAGVDPERFPSDLAVFARYRDSLRRTRPRWPLPPPLEPTDLDGFAREHAGRYGVTLR
ncbi:MAG TPA: hypothetical protein VFN68_14200 [Acidimicrobiales bacterium]|nr:hypothetical protein [Acidimicrobiales bacterium]